MSSCITHHSSTLSSRRSTASSFILTSSTNPSLSPSSFPSFLSIWIFSSSLPPLFPPVAISLTHPSFPSSSTPSTPTDFSLIFLHSLFPLLQLNCLGLISPFPPFSPLFYCNLLPFCSVSPISSSSVHPSLDLYPLSFHPALSLPLRSFFSYHFTLDLFTLPLPLPSPLLSSLCHPYLLLYLQLLFSTVPYHHPITPSLYPLISLFSLLSLPHLSHSHLSPLIVLPLFPLSSLSVLSMLSSPLCHHLPSLKIDACC